MRKKNRPKQRDKKTRYNEKQKQNKHTKGKMKSGVRQRLGSVFALFCQRRHETWSILINYLISERHNSNSPGAHFRFASICFSCIRAFTMFLGFNLNAISHQLQICALCILRSSLFFFGIRVIAATGAAAAHTFKFNSIIVPFISLYIVFNFSISIVQ